MVYTFPISDSALFVIMKIGMEGFLKVKAQIKNHYN